METSRHATRRSASSIDLSENTDDLPSYALDELDEFQASVPMPSRTTGRPAGVGSPGSSDQESTEEITLAAVTPARHARPGDGPNKHERPKTVARTQPIAVSRLTPGAPPRQDKAADNADGAVAFRQDAGITVMPRRRINCGDVLANRYVVTAKVDHNGMGKVYKALDRQREKAGSPAPWVALKFAAAPDGDDTTNETSACLRQEFLKLSQLNHPNVVSVFDLACDEGLDFIVMEWLAGDTLAGLLSRITGKRIALDRATGIVQSVGRGLAHAHELGIVHGDVKPSNIFVTDNRAVKLLDFGSSGQTMSGEPGGSERTWATRAYASREILQGHPPQPRDDVFALGVTAYCLLSGERPFGTLDALSASEQRASPEPLPADSDDRWPAVAHALEFDAAERPATAADFLREFDEAAGEPDIVSRPVQAPTVAYGALAVVLLASLVWWSAQSVGGLSRAARIALDRGDVALSEGRLVGPERNNAFVYYSTVLTGDPDNSRALAGMDSIARQYLTRARDAIAANDLDAALADLTIAKRVNPDHFGVAAIEDLIARHGRDILVRASEALDSDLQDAERLVTQAASLLAPNDPELLRVRGELAERKVAAKVASLLQDIDARILAERLLVPQGDSAADLLREATKLSPDDPAVLNAAQRIMTALLFQAMFAISNGDLDDAQNFIEAAKKMGIKHIALARAEYELAKARRDALRKL